MANSTESNVTADRDLGAGEASQPSPTDLNALFDKYLDEAASQPKYANRKERAPVCPESNEEAMESWQTEIDRTPAFMNDIPEDPGDNSLLQALQAIKYDPGDPPEEQARVHKEDGNEWFRKRKYKLAVTAYTEGLKQSFEDSDLRAVLHTNRAAAAFHLGNFRSSLRDATEAVRHKPNHLKAWLRGAECCLRLELLEEAVEWCDSALKIAADDKRALDMRTTATKKKSLAERNRRRQKAEERNAEVRRMKIVEAIQARGIKFCQVDEGESIKTQENLVKDAVSFQHQTGARISLDESGNLTWPVTFLYPEFSQSDFIQAFHEHSVLSDHLRELFAETAPWDSQGAYQPDTVQVYFHHLKAKKLVCVSHDATLGATLQDSRYVVANEPLFVVLPKGTAFAESYLKRFSEMH